MARIIDKETKQFLRDDFHFNPETEIALTAPPSQGLYIPKWNGETWVEGRNAAEIAPLVAAKAEAKAIVVNENNIRAKLKAQIATLQADLGASTDAAGSTTLNAILNQTNAVINASAATYIKALARIMKTNQKADIRDIRLMLRDLSTPDTDA